jgi:CRP-like cAMP-binding protein
MAESDPPRPVDLLANCAWWRGLDAAQRERWLAEIEERRFSGGSVVMCKGETVDARTGAIDGLVKLSSVSAAGNSVTFAGVGPDGWFGEGSPLKDEPRKYDIVALRDTRMAWMRRATFDWLLGTSIAFNRFLRIQPNERLGQFIDMVELVLGGIRIIALAALRRYRA